jgi:uncharacterized protein (DUF362 family)
LPEYPQRYLSPAEGKEELGEKAVHKWKGLSGFLIGKRMENRKETEMNRPFVSVAKGDDPYRTTSEILSSFPFSDLEGKKVLIKPNAARMAAPGEGVTTNPGVVAAIVDFLKRMRAREIIIGESCILGVEASAAFRKTGIEEVAREKNVTLLDLDRLDPLDIRIPGGKLLKTIKVSSIVKEVGLIVSVPVMKTHMHTRVTLGIKNMKGLLWKREKARFHHLAANPDVVNGEKELDVAIAEMATGLAPHLVVIDGMVGMEGMGPGYGKAKRMGVVVASANALAADVVASRLMGFDPREVPHLRLCHELGLGEIRLEQISVAPPDFIRWEDPFEPPPARISISYPDVAVYDRGSCSACLSTLMIFLQEQRHRLDEYRLQDNKFHVAIGKYLQEIPEGTVLLGNCTQKFRDQGKFIQGCPPISSQILETLHLQKGKKKGSGRESP